MKIIETLKKIPTKTYISIVMVVIAVINHILLAMGKPVLVIGEETVTYTVNTAIDILLIGYTAWKNNSVTDYAILTDSLLYYLRDGKISKEELEQFIKEHKSDEVPTE